MLQKEQQKAEKTANSPRSRGVMYVQQLDKMKFSSLDALKRRVQSLSKLKRFAMIVHDKDTNGDNELVKPHVHVMLEFESPRMISAIAKELDDAPEHFESMTKHNKNGINNGFAYLVHRTKNASNKYQYDPDKVIANFNYQSFLDKLKTEVNEGRYEGKMGISNLLGDFINGKLTKIEAKEIAKNSKPGQFAYICKRIDESEVQMEELKADKWIQEMQGKHEAKKVFWIYGPAGVGKTTLAKMITESLDKGYFTTGSSRDYFQNYHGEHCILVDELRPNIIDYSDLLRILDPYNYNCNVPSRYHDHRLTANAIVITSPFSPGDFYIHQRDLNTEVDAFKQLHRRLNYVIQVKPLKIRLMELISDYVPGEMVDGKYRSATPPQYGPRREVMNYVMVAIESGKFQENYDQDSRCILSVLKKLISGNTNPKEKSTISKTTK